MKNIREVRGTRITFSITLINHKTLPYRWWCMGVFLAGFIRDSPRSAISISIHIYLCHKSIFNPRRCSLSLSKENKNRMSPGLCFQCRNFSSVVVMCLSEWSWCIGSEALPIQWIRTKTFIMLLSGKAVSQLSWCFCSFLANNICLQV